MRDSSRSPAAPLHLLVKGKPNAVRQLCESSAQSRCKWCVSEICAVLLPAAQIPIWCENTNIQRIEYQEAQMHTLTLPDDSLLLWHNNVLPAHLGENLPQGFRGEGVLVSIIDDGFDWRHPDFQRADSSSRVQYLWDQGLQSNWTEQQFGYGSVWSQQDIDAGLCQQLPNTHGIHVAGIAAGNARAANKFMGVAPEADLLWIKVAEGSGAFLPQFVDAVYWSALKSQILGMPCSINSSVGSYNGGHDGLDLYSQAIDEIIRQTPGFALSQAAGNARAYNFHVKAQTSSVLDTARVCFKYHNARGNTNFVIYADTANFNNINFSLQNIANSSFRSIASSQEFNILRDFYTPDNSSSQFYIPFFQYNNGNSVYLYLTIGNYEGQYEIFFRIISPSSSNYWQLTTSGQGHYDCWSAEGLTGSSDILPSAPIPNYVSPDNQQSIVGYWNCAHEVISVASYQNQTYMINYAQDSFYLGTAGFPQGGISQFSSLGPTRDGRLKPEIAASGGQVLSAAPLSNLYGYRQNFYANLDEAGWHVSNRGTSMSAPIVAGAIALYLQCQPHATASEIRQALHQSARVDSLVFIQNLQVPNQHWGYGKLDVHNLLSRCLRYGCTDSLAANFDPLANINSNACLYLGANLYNSSPNTNFSVYPNPVNLAQATNIRLEMPENYLTNSHVYVYTAEGRLLADLPTNTTINLAALNVSASNNQTLVWICIYKKGLPTLRQAILLMP